MSKQEKYNLNENYDTIKDKEFSERDYFGFWDQVSKKYVKWDKMYDKVYCDNDGENNGVWYKGGKLNICYNVLDVHANDPITKDQVAIIHLYPNGGCNKITYYELWKKVCIFSKALKQLGINKGDGVLIYMPTNIECAIAMLSCARIGAIHSILFSGFPSSNVASAIDYFKPKLMVVSSCAIHKVFENSHFLKLISDALEISNHKVENVIVHNRDLYKELNDIHKIPNSLDFDELLNTLEFKENPYNEYEIVETEHPINLTFTSGTTGKPKGVVVKSGPLISLMNYNMRNIVKVNKGDVYFSTTDIGWLVAQNESVYGCLAVGVTSVIVEGVPLSPSEFYQTIETFKVKVCFIAPTEVRIFKKSDPDGEIALKYDLSSLKLLHLGGEKLDVSSAEYLMKSMCKAISDNYGQSESSCAFISCVDYGYKFKSVGKSTPGYNVSILKESGEITKPGEIGELVVKYPLPPCFVSSLSLDSNNIYKTINKYPGYYSTGDLSYSDEDGYIYILSRSDDVVNIGSERIYCGQVEEIVLTHPDVLDCVVIGVKDETYGERLVALILFKSDLKNYILKSIHKELNIKISKEVTFCYFTMLKFLVPISVIPKNKSGKKLRKVITNIFNDESYITPPSISNIEHLKQIEIEINHFKSTVTDQGYNILE